MTWKPFKTAPDDGSVFLAHSEEFGIVTLRSQQPPTERAGIEGHDPWVTVAGQDASGLRPTHWMPLPAGPRQPEQVSPDDTATLNRIGGERRRFRAAIERLRGHVNALADTVADGHPTTSTRQSVTITAVQVTEHAAVIDALARIDRDTKPEKSQDAIAINSAIIEAIRELAASWKTCPTCSGADGRHRYGCALWRVIGHSFRGSTMSEAS